MSTYSNPSQIDILILRVSRERDAVYPFVSKLLILYRWKDHGEVRSLLLQFLSLVNFYCLFPPTRASSISVCSSCFGKCQTADKWWTPRPIPSGWLQSYSSPSASISVVQCSHPKYAFATLCGQAH